MKKFPNYKQAETKDCGPTCIKIIAKHYGKSISLEQIRNLSETQREGTSLLHLSHASEKIGFRSLSIKTSLNELRELPLPCILFWNKSHYVVLYKITKNYVYISDPGYGLLKYNKKDFLKNWIGNNSDELTHEGIALLLEPSSKFYNSDFKENNTDTKLGFKFLLGYVLKYKNFLWQLIIGLIASSLLQLIFPFLTQSVVDIGIKNQDIHFIYLVLFSQLTLFCGRTAIEVIRRWVLLHLSTRINISLVSDFFIKLMDLPIAFFDSKMTGDILQRINDHQRIERILTISSLGVLFSMVNLVVFSIVLIYYNLSIFGVFVIGSVLYFIWIAIFLKKRKELDYKRFSEASQEQSKVIELVNGMQEIKLHNSEKQKRWSWEFQQARLFKISVEGLILDQYQTVGSSFINEFKNIFITILSAQLVIEGKITLGMMLAISYIVGQLNSPIAGLINFVREVQDARISLDRLSEIHNKEDEEPIEIQKNNDIDTNANFVISNLSFSYTGSNDSVLKNLNFNIPAKKITAIVGASGSGKTTLMKVLLKFYNPNSGNIKFGNYDLKNLSPKAWRNECGVVMQEGYIFNDTIANNIAVGVDLIDKQKLAHAVKIANIKEFIENLPLSYNTKIGMEGVGLSTGQKQRLLIARSVYKDPSLLFFDEATSALDSNNEKIIMENLNTFFKNKTVIVIAHRLSTVKNADQIIVLNRGEVIEIGNHQNLVAQRGSYYNLVKNQLELGN